MWDVNTEYLLLGAKVPFEVDHAEPNDNMQGEGTWAQDSSQPDVRQGDEVGEQADHKLWVTPGASNKEVAKNQPEGKCS